MDLNANMIIPEEQKKKIPTLEELNKTIENAFYLFVASQPLAFLALKGRHFNKKAKINNQCDRMLKRLNYLNDDGSLNKFIKSLMVNIV